MRKYLSKLFVVSTRRKAEKGEAFAAAAPEGESVGVFITPKSLMTFPTASLAVSVLSLLAKTLFPDRGGSAWVTVACSLFIGTIIFVATTSDPSVKPQTGRGWFLGTGVALINSLFLAASALGLLNQLGPQ